MTEGWIVRKKCEMGYPCKGDWFLSENGSIIVWTHPNPHAAMFELLSVTPIPTREEIGKHCPHCYGSDNNSIYFGFMACYDLLFGKVEEKEDDHYPDDWF